LKLWEGAETPNGGEKGKSRITTLVQQSGNMYAQPEAVRACPKCGSEMVLRVAKKGLHAGKIFWGCSKFPECRGMVSVEG
jgi:restriction system protein